MLTNPDKSRVTIRFGLSTRYIRVHERDNVAIVVDPEGHAGRRRLRAADSPHASAFRSRTKLR